ncbi:MAG: helix-turn-helix transcriptional regulator [Microbacterium sp.]
MQADDAQHRPTREEFARAVGVNLRRFRLRRGLSQGRLAYLVGISGYTYQKFERGESKPGTPLNPQLFTLIALAEVLDVELSDIAPRPWPAPAGSAGPSS